jgi:hypothetical protein
MVLLWPMDVMSSGVDGATNLDYPLVICYIANWEDPPFLMGKSTISMAIFNSKLLVYQRVFGQIQI